MKQPEYRQVDFNVHTSFRGPDEEEYIVLSESETEQCNFYYARLTSLVALGVVVDKRTIRINVPFSGKRVAPAMDMLYHFGSGSFLRASMSLTKRYLTEMYFMLRQRHNAPFPATSDEVFSNPKLLVIQAAFLHLTGLKVRDELAKNNYQWERPATYVSLFGRESGEVNAPRTLNYYPQDHATRAQWVLGSSLADAKIYVSPGPHSSNGRYYENVFRIHRVYEGKPWLTLSDVLEEEPRLASVVKAYYDCGIVSGPRFPKEE